MVSKPKSQKPRKHHAGRELLALIDKHRNTIPEEEFEKLPVDGASNHDYYLYAKPKRK
jgi:hypothetical protein